MKIARMPVIALAISLCAVTYAQDAQGGAAPPASGQDGIHDGQSGGHGWGRGMSNGMNSAVMGTVTETAADHFTVKDFAGETWTVHYGANTTMMKQPASPVGAQGDKRGELIKTADIKVGDAIMAGGAIDRDAKSVGAIILILLDSERAKQLQEMQANYGKTWLMGRVTAINKTIVTLEDGQASHTFVADENTSFRRFREPVTLFDVQPGDTVRVEGAIKHGQFVATTVNVMAPPARGGPARRQGPPPQ